MPSTVTTARVVRAHNTSLFVVVALGSDKIKPGGFIDSATFHEDVTHEDDRPLEHGDVCRIETSGELVRCGHL